MDGYGKPPKGDESPISGFGNCARSSCRTKPKRDIQAGVELSMRIDDSRWVSSKESIEKQKRFENNTPLKSECLYNVFIMFLKNT